VDVADNLDRLLNLIQARMPAVGFNGKRACFKKYGRLVLIPAIQVDEKHNIPLVNLHAIAVFEAGELFNFYNFVNTAHFR
jgi:hypothetical protein